MAARARRDAAANRCNVICRHSGCGLVVDVEKHVTDEDLLAQLRRAVFHK
jgi:hypothetical protein